MLNKVLLYLIFFTPYICSIVVPYMGQLYT